MKHNFENEVRQLTGMADVERRYNEQFDKLDADPTTHTYTFTASQRKILYTAVRYAFFDINWEAASDTRSPAALRGLEQMLGTEEEKAGFAKAIGEGWN